MKRKGLIITFSILGAVGSVLGAIVVFYFCLAYASKETIAKAVTYYRRDDSYITINATITRLEQFEANYYSIYLQYDEQCHDLRFAEDYEIIPSNTKELEKNDFDFAQSDKQYIITVGRRKIHNGSVPLITYPVVEIREAGEDGKVYLDYETGKSNLLSYLSKK
ncbi:MAG: hypothetical protein K2M89_03240 [Clostridiales bacterium]|nr:hypothetical protein [Clostridiales bacterium]